MLNFYALIGKEIDDIAKGACRTLIKFTVATLCAGDHHKFLILNIKDLRQRTAGGSDFIHLVLLVVAFHANVLSLFHDT
jgi:hypothetical protein